MRRDNKRIDIPVAEQHTARALLLRSNMMNILNSKVAFFLAFLPRFVSQSSGSAPTQMVLLSLIFTLLVMLIFGAIGLFAGALKRVLV